MSREEEKKPQPSAVTIGLGPEGLALSGILNDAGFDSTGFGEYSYDELVRQQVLGFSDEDFLNHCRFLYKLPSLDTIESLPRLERAARLVDLFNTTLAKRKSKPPINIRNNRPRRYAQLNMPGPSNIDLVTPLFFQGGPSVTIEIKHIEQMLSLTTGFNAPSDSPTPPQTTMIKHRRTIADIDGSTHKDLGPVKSMQSDGTITRDDGETIHPTLLCLSDGASSLTSGITHALNETCDSEAKLIPAMTRYSETVNPEHSVGIYNITPSSTDHIDTNRNLNDFLDQRLSHLQLPTGTVSSTLLPHITTISEYHTLGWDKFSPPEYRLLRGKNTLYVSAETPKAILDEPDATIKQAKIQQWHDLILQNVIPARLKSQLYIKGNSYSKSTDTAITARKRTLREKIRFTSFPVDVDHQPYLQKHTTQLASIRVLVCGDAVESTSTHHHTATGLWYGFNCAIALKHALAKYNPEDPTYMTKVFSDYEASATQHQIDKHLLTESYQRMRLFREITQKRVAEQQFVRLYNRLDEGTITVFTCNTFTRLSAICTLKHNGHTLLTRAIELSRWDIVNRLSDIRDINSIMTDDGRLPLEIAMEKISPIPILLKLIPKDLNLLNTYRTKAGISLVKHAQIYKLPAVILELTELGVDSNQTGPLHISKANFVIELKILKTRLELHHSASFPISFINTLIEFAEDHGDTLGEENLALIFRHTLAYGSSAGEGFLRFTGKAPALLADSNPNRTVLALLTKYNLFLPHEKGNLHQVLHALPRRVIKTLTTPHLDDDSTQDHDSSTARKRIKSG